MARLEHPLFSIIVPVRNGAEFIRNTLLSIRNQGRRDVEVILADSESNDNTVEIARQFDGLSVAVSCERDRGQLDGLQRGLKLAKGDIIHWLNADDIMMPGTLDYVADTFRANPAVDLIYSDDYAFSEDNKSLYVGSTNQGLRYEEHVLFYLQMCSECVFWRASATRFLPEENFDLKVYTDYAFISNLERGRKTMWVSKRLGAFRIQPNQMSRVHGERKKKEFDLVRRRLYSASGWSMGYVRVLQILHAPQFFLRHIVALEFKRGIRRVIRFLTRDRERQLMIRTFYEGWLGKEAPDVVAVTRILFR